MLEKNEHLVCVYDNVDNFIIRHKDIPDFIVDYSDNHISAKLRIYEYEDMATTPIITTIGCFLDYCDPHIRDNIVNRLQEIHFDNKIKHYKVIDENDLKEVKNELNITSIKI